MKLLALAAGLPALAAAAELPRGLSEDSAHTSGRIPTSYESAVMGRRVLALTKLATLSTVFPESHAPSGADEDDTQTFERRPTGLDGIPIGLMDYVADCEDDGNPTFLEIKIGTSFKNARAGSNMTVSYQWVPPYPPSKRISFLSRFSSYLPFFGHFPYNRAPELTSAPDTVPYSAANLPRFSLVGYLEPIRPDPVSSVRLASCYTTKHPDSKYWLPGNPIHESEWARLVVTQVYWIGGFGDRAYIGWIPIEEWKAVTKEEWSSIKLVGEQPGWSEWSVNEQVGEL